MTAIDYPPGFKKAIEIQKLPFEKNTAYDWKSLVKLFMKTNNISDEIGEIANLLEDGHISVNNSLLLRNICNDNCLQGCHCAYICPTTCQQLVDIVRNLLRLGNRSFSILVSSISMPLEEIYSQLINECCSIDGCVAFTFWVDLHVDYLLATLEKCKLHTIGDNNPMRQLTIGLLVPSLFIRYFVSGKPWKTFDASKIGKQWSTLYLKHGASYDAVYESLPALKCSTVNSNNVLMLIIWCALFAKVKILVFLRDMCYSETSAHYERKHCSENKCIPNHLGEVPMEIDNDKVILKYSAFLNIDKIGMNQTNVNRCTSFAYKMLKSIMKTIAAEHSANEDVLLNCELRAAVGFIGYANMLRNSVTLWDIEKLALVSQHCPTKLYPMSGAVSSLTWDASEGIWQSFVPYKICNNSTMLISRSFLQYLSSNASALMNVDANENYTSIMKEAHNFMTTEIEKYKQKCISTPLHYQVDILRKICGSFFSTTSMPLIVTHDDLKLFPDEKKLVSLVIDIFLQNYSSNCAVLLPEIRTSVHNDYIVKGDGKISKEKANISSSFLNGIYDGLKFWPINCNPVTKFAKTVIAEIIRKHVEHLQT